MKFFTIFILFLLFSSNALHSQSPYTNVMIDNAFSNGFYPEEPTICINPKNTNILVAGSNLSNFYHSSNGGLNWINGTMTSSYTVWGDPAVIVDTSGNFYYFHLTNPGAVFIDRIVCQKSTDAGGTWSNGSYTGYNPPKGQDKAWGAVDFTHGPRGNWIYVTWTQFDFYGTNNSSDSSNILFSRSTDGGLTWDAAIGAKRLNQKAGDCVDSDNTMEGAVPCVGPNGEIYVCWAGTISLNTPRLFFTKSTDGGTTWLPNNLIIGTQPGGWDYFINGIYRSNGLPITCCDVSNGPNRGTVYVNYTDSISTTDHDVKIIKSTNGGTTWSAPIRVNDDAAGKEQFFSWMTIDQATGFLYVVFYDRRNYTNNLTTDVFLAHSTDGGNTWVNERISATSFTPNSGEFFGDYTNVTAYNGHVRPIWARMDANTSVWTAIIDFPLGVNPVNNVIPKSFALHQNYPNPFNPTTKIRFDIPVRSAGETTLKVYDQLGKEVASLLHENLSAGTYEINWDASEHASGVYYYTLAAGSFKQTKKMIITK